jgi:hypothetical protein
MDSAQQLASRSHRRSLAQELRTAFEDVDVRLGELLVDEVEGEVDAMGGAIATVEDSGSSWQVRLMPALRDDGVLLVAQLFHPRLHAWSDHFIADVSGEILGLTAIGRATITSLSMNRVLAVAIRHEERARDRWP